MEENIEKEYRVRTLKTKDLFTVSKIMKKMDIKEEVKTILTPYLDDKTTNKEQAEKELGTTFAFMLFENLYRAEDELLDFIGDLVGMGKDQLGELPFIKTVDLIKQIFSQEGIIDFLKLAAK